MDERLAAYEAAGATTLVAVPAGDRSALVRTLAAAVGERGCLSAHSARPGGIAGSDLPGPFPVGALRRPAARPAAPARAGAAVRRGVEPAPGRAPSVFFELRDGTGAVPCSMWRNEFETLGRRPSAWPTAPAPWWPAGPDYYPGSRTSSPSFSFLVSDLRVAG